jgi:hypothetical protein
MWMRNAPSVRYLPLIPAYDFRRRTLSARSLPRKIKKIENSRASVSFSFMGALIFLPEQRFTARRSRREERLRFSAPIYAAFSHISSRILQNFGKR